MTIQVSDSDSGLFRFIHDCGHPECRNSGKLIWRWICATFWYNRASNCKGGKFGTNEADIIWTNNRTEGILKLSYFWNNSICPFRIEAFDHISKNGFSNLVYLRNRSYSSNELEKLIQNDIWIKRIRETFAN